MDKASSSDATSNQSWAAVSSMVNNEIALEDNDKTLVDWIKEDNTKKFSELASKWSVSEVESVVNFRDENGLGLIHWAADRGNKDIVKLLLDIKDLDVNQRDNEGQTALHYACSCGHLDVIETLLNCSKLDRNIRDNDNLLPEDAAVDKEVIELLKVL